MNLNIASQLHANIPVYLASQNWFVQPSDGSHTDPGYDSRDPAVIANDVAVAKGLGFSGFVPDHYSLNEPSHQAQMALLKECEKQGLKFMLMQEIKFFHDKNADLANVVRWCRANVFNSPAYPRINGKIPFFEFDWKINGVDPAQFMQSNPDILVIQRNAGTGAGAYGWPDGFDTPHGWQNYLHWYHATFPASFAPCFWQFDDHLAPWHPTPNRVVLPRSGATLRYCIDQINAAVAAGNKPPGVLFATYDDFDEGTAARDLMHAQMNSQSAIPTPIIRAAGAIKSSVDALMTAIGSNET